MGPDDIGQEDEGQESGLLVHNGSTVAPNDGTAGHVLLLPPSVERELNNGDESLGSLGRPFDRRTPFFVGLTGALGVDVPYVSARGIADITSVLVVIGLALFIAIGLKPIVDFLTDRGVARGVTVLIVTLGFVLVIAGFVFAAVPPI